jgi:glycosyltransferase involved in cell wall biosynthesis
MEEITQKTSLYFSFRTFNLLQGGHILMEKALIITPFYAPNIGGAETFAQDLAKALSKKYVVHICTIKWDKPVLWQGLPYSKGFQMLFRLFLSYGRMKKNKYKKVYALGIIPSILCMMYGIKFSSVILALYDIKQSFLMKSILNSAEKVYVEGMGGEEEMLEIGVNKDKLIKFNHWVDQTKFCFTPKNNNNMKVLFVGRPIRIKGKHIIEACQQITKDIDYEYVENCKYEDLPKHYQDSDVCVVPSLYPEGFSRVVIESASCGCAVITSDNGSLPELVGKFGKVIKPTPINFAKELTLLKNNRKALEKIQINTVVYALENFSEKNADCFLLCG